MDVPDDGGGAAPLDLRRLAAPSVSAVAALLGLLCPGAPPLPPSTSPPHRRTSTAPPSRPCLQCPPHSRPLPLSPPRRRQRPLPPPRQLHLRLRRLRPSAGGGSPIPVVSGFQGDAFIASALVGFYLNFSKVGDATKVFDGMSERDMVAWNAFVSGLVKGCNFVPALQVLFDVSSCSVFVLESSGVFFFIFFFLFYSYNSNWLDILYKFGHVEVLTLCGKIIEDMFCEEDIEREILPIEFGNLYELQILLIEGLQDDLLIGFYHFFRHCIFPSLEKLFIELEPLRLNHPIAEGTCVSDSPDQVLSNLRIVKINGFHGYRNEIMFIEFFCAKSCCS